MGSNDIPPPHVPSHVVPTCNLLLQVGGGLWTICYILYARESFKTKSYGMPLFALANNYAWEVVYGIYVAESPLEKSVFIIWLIIDCFMVYGLLSFGRHEWSHAPFIAHNIGAIFLVMAALATAGHWSFANWWIKNNIGMRQGKTYRGVIGPDTSELGFWSALFNQLYLSAASLCQLIIRQHSGGVNWKIWFTRTAGSILGFYAVYGWDWYFWPEAHEYVVNPLALFCIGTSLACDLVYGCVLQRVRMTEKTQTDGRKFSGLIAKTRRS